MLKDTFIRLFGQKIYYEKEPPPLSATTYQHHTGLTPCPWGGSIAGPDGVMREGIKHLGAMVGSHACADCKFNKKLLWEYVRCSRTKKEGETN